MSNPAGSALSPAPDYETIFDVETAVESACATVLAAVPYSLTNVYTTRSAAIRAYPHAEVKFTLGAEQGHRGVLADGVTRLADAWHGSLILTAASTRSTVGGIAPGVLRARLRLSMQYFKAQFTPDVLLYHSLTSIVHQASDQGYDSQHDTDWTQITFAVVVSVRPLAWPT